MWTLWISGLERPPAQIRPPMCLLANCGWAGSAPEGYTEEFVPSPDQSTLASGSEAVTVQLEIKRHNRQVLGANAGTEICDVANCAGLNTGFLAEK